MDWLKHPSYDRLRTRLARKLQGRRLQTARMKPLVFLCGGSDSARRAHVASYIRRHMKHLSVFYADDVWRVIAGHATQNALAMENELARLASVVVLIVESPGTFAELGAFSLNPALRPKLLPILDRRFRTAPSFINTGPVAWVDQDSRFAPSLYADFDVILGSVSELQERLGRLPRHGTGSTDDTEAWESRSLLPLICDIVAILGPLPLEHCQAVVKEVTGESPDVPLLLALAAVMGMVKEVKETRGTTFFYTDLADDGGLTLRQRRKFSLEHERARALSVLLQLPGYLLALQAARGRTSVA